MINCKLCNKDCKNLSILSRHIKAIHNLDTNSYYDKFIITNLEEKYCKYCKKENSFYNIKKGYNLFCSRSCIASFSNTNNWKREEYKTRQTQILKNNSQNVRTSNIEMKSSWWKNNPDKKRELSERNKQNWKDPLFKEKMISILKENDCLFSSEEISKRNRENWKSLDYREKMSKNTSSGRGISGNFIENNIYFASSYEAIVIYEYLSSGKNIERCSKEFFIPYKKTDGKDSFYIPDFYVKEDNLIIEVKATWQIEKNHNDAKTKILEATKYFSQKNINYKVITEKEINTSKFKEIINKKLIKLNKKHEHLLLNTI